MPPIIAITAKTEELRSRSQTTIPVAYAKAVEEAGGLPFIVPIINLRGNIAAVAKGADGFIFSGGDDIRPGYYGEEPLLPLELSPDERTDFEIALFTEVMRLGKPVLGICLGAQLINVALGGTLYQDIPSQIPDPLDHRKRHIVSIKEGTLLHRIFTNPQPPGYSPPPHIIGSSSAKKPMKGKLEEIQPLPSSASKDNDGGFNKENCIQMAIVSAHHQAIKHLGKGLIVSAFASDGVVEAIEMPDYPFLIGVQWHPERELDDEYTKRLFKAFVENVKLSRRERV